MEKITLFFFGDLGLGSLFGGFGLIFWGLGFPAFLYLMIRSVMHLRYVQDSRNSSCWFDQNSRGTRDWFPVFFWGQLILGLGALFFYARSTELLFRSGRLVLFVTGFGILALGVVWKKLSKEVPGSDFSLKLLCLGGAVLTLILLGGFRDPQYNFSEVLRDRIGGEQPSPYKYFYLGNLLEPLDAISQAGGGLSVYVAGPHEYYWTGPFYGIKIQNRIWNFEDDQSTDPDVFVFHQTENHKELFYLRRKITPGDVALNPNYVLITQDRDSLFFLKDVLLDDSQRLEALIRYYRGLLPDSLTLAKDFSSTLEPDALILTSLPFGYNLRYLELNQEIPQKVRLVPIGVEDQIAQQLDADLIYSFRRPLVGFKSKHFIDLHLGDEEVAVFRNERE